MGCAYKLGEFLAACAAGTTRAYVTRGAMDTATADFRLMNQRQALIFLAGFEEAQFKLQDSSLWRNNAPAMCDAYTFSDGAIDGYVSFGWPRNGDNRWVIKSLKFNNRGKR